MLELSSLERIPIYETYAAEEGEDPLGKEFFLCRLNLLFKRSKSDM